MPRIMIVDDSAAMRKNLTFALTKAGHEVVAQATNGEQAYYFYKMHSPDLVTMDITMPETNGIEATRRIMKDFPEAKIIMVSALDQKEMVLEALRLGAKHYVIKPINPQHLTTVINKVLGISAPPSLVPDEESEKTKLEEKIKELEMSRKKLEEDNLKLARLSNMDGLTGIPNRRHFDEILAKEWKRGQRDRTPVSLLMLDIDFFKNYNDSLGHLDGDECIRNVAKLITDNLKRPLDVAARYGGEEFSVILPGTDRIGAVYVAEFIRK